MPFPLSSRPFEPGAVRGGSGDRLRASCTGVSRRAADGSTSGVTGTGLRRRAQVAVHVELGEHVSGAGRDRQAPAGAAPGERTAASSRAAQECRPPLPVITAVASAAGGGLSRAGPRPSGRGPSLTSAWPSAHTSRIHRPEHSCPAVILRCARATQLLAQVRMLPSLSRSSTAAQVSVHQ